MAVGKIMQTEEVENIRDCSWDHRRRCKIILVAYLVSILVSGLALPLKHYNWAIWPWKNTWFIFSFASNVLTKIEVYGQLEYGKEIQIDMKKWFAAPVGFETARYNEIPYQYFYIKKLADYVCQQYNEEAVAGQRLNRVSVWIAVWNQWSNGRKTRVALPEAQKKGVVEYQKMGIYECSIGNNIL